MAILKCKMCGGDIELSADKTFGMCDSCGSTMTFPKVDDEQRANRFNRGNQFRRTGEFDKALAVYEQIVQEDENDAEAHWCCALCRFGIEYVEDPNTFEYLPTCHRASFDSFLEDVDYLAAVEHSEGITRRQYQKDAAKIAEVQRGILATSQNEEPFDVFICYKESENDGSRTRDSLLAQEIYYQLTEQGRRVFFSRITLEDKAGTEYEPYIFAALNSAKVMILVTTSAEHANAVWVKNEWSRFLSLMRKDRTKLLLPCYRDMDPYDLPEALSVLQSYDMSKIGFIQDLTRGVNKVLNAGKPKETVKETVVVQQGNANAAPLLKRAFMFLEDGDFARADEFCEQVLNLDPENAEAYLGKLMAELGVKTREGLKDQPQPFDGGSNYKKAFRFGDEKLKAELSHDIAFIKDRNETARKTGIYNDGVKAMNAASTESEYKKAAASFKTVPGFRDADALAERCLEQAEICRKDAIYQAARSQMTGSVVSGYESAVKLFRTISGWKDAEDQILACQRKIEEIKAQEEADRKEAERKAEEQRLAEKKHEKRMKLVTAIVLSAVGLIVAAVVLYFTVIEPNQRYNAAKALYDEGKYVEAINAFQEMNGYRDSEAQIEACKTAIKDRDYDAAVALYNAGKYEEAIAAFQAMKGYRDSAAQIETCQTAIKERDYNAAVDLYNAGKYEEAVAAFEALNGYKDSAAQIEACKTAIKDRDYDAAVALYADGQYMKAVSIFRRLDNYKESKKYLNEYWDHAAVRSTIAAGSRHTVGLRSDGTVVAVGNNSFGQCGVSGWTDIVSIAAGPFHTVGLKSNGTVVAVGWDNDGRCDVSGWTDIVAIAAGENHTVGLRSDGTVVAVGRTDYGRCDVSGWTDIVAIAAGLSHTVGLKSDGTVVAVGNSGYGQCGVSGWTDIAAIAAGTYHTVGLKSDGTVVAVGYNGSGQCGVSGWTDIAAIAAGTYHTVGLRSDGTAVAVGDNGDGQCGVSGWTDIVAIAAGSSHTVGLKSDGTVAAVGDNYYGQCSVSDWKNVRIPKR